MYTCIKLFYDHQFTQSYLLEFYRNFKCMLTTPKMSETGTKATSTQYISPDLYFTRDSTCRNSDWVSAKTPQEETDTILTFHTKLNVSKALVQHYTVLNPIVNIKLKQSDVLYVLDNSYKLLHSLKCIREGCTIPFPIIVL